MVVTYCYLERENDKILKFHLNNSLKALKLNKHRGCLLEEILYIEISLSGGFLQIKFEVYNPMTQFYRC